jgi:hypothetical protein
LSSKDRNCLHIKWLWLWALKADSFDVLIQ